MSLAKLFRPDDYPYLTYRIVNGMYVKKAELQAAKAANPSIPVPEIILDYESRMRRGEIKRPGRPEAGLKLLFATILARSKYPVLLRRLKWRNQHVGLKGWAAMKGKSWWEGPPHKIAAKMIRARYFKHCDWPHVLNLIHDDKNER